MKFLAVDTSSLVGTVVAMEWEPNSKAKFNDVRLVAEWTLNIESSHHSEKLLWAIHQVLEAAGWELSELSFMGVGVGPGSFTGLRIGLTTIKTLAKVLSKPVVGVSSLAVLSRPASIYLNEYNQNTLMIAATDACKGEYYCLSGLAKEVKECVVSGESGKNFKNGLWKRGVIEKVLKTEEMIDHVLSRLNKNKKLNWCVVSKQHSKNIWSELPKRRQVVLPVPFLDLISGKYLGMLVWEGFQAGLSKDASEILPRYLRESDAEIKLKAGLLPSAPTRGGNV